MYSRKGSNSKNDGGIKMKKTIAIASTVILAGLVAFGVSTGKIAIQQGEHVQVAEKAVF